MFDYQLWALRLVITSSGLKSVKSTSGTGTSLFLKTSLIATASADRTPNPDLVTHEKSHSSTSLPICLSSTVPTSWPAGRSSGFTGDWHGSKVLPSLMYWFPLWRFFRSQVTSVDGGSVILRVISWSDSRVHLNCKLCKFGRDETSGAGKAVVT